jgi:predicted component of type VI protein secretion system
MNKSSFYFIYALFLTLTLIGAGCGESGRKSDEQQRQEINAALARQEKVTAETERLRRELSQIPDKEQLTKTPYRGSNGLIYIL